MNQDASGEIRIQNLDSWKVRFGFPSRYNLGSQVVAKGIKMEQVSIQQLINVIDEHRKQHGLKPMTDDDWLRFSELLEQRVHANGESEAEPACYQITEDEWNAECAREDASRACPLESDEPGYL